MRRGIWLTLGATLGVGGALLVSRRASASTSSGQPAQKAPAPAIELAPLPRAGDVSGDLTRNWGETPFDLRSLFLLMEETSRIPGAGRVLAIFAHRESRFITTAHNGDAPEEQGERDASARGYNNNKEKNPPLRYGGQAAAFGSGGLFGLLAPYFLWSGVPEVGARAPLLAAPPELMFQPRAAAFAATVYLQRILKNYRVDDIPDVKAGWASPALLTSARGSKDYQDVRARFLADAKTLGIDLSDGTIPSKLDASAWPGVPTVFAGLVGALPRELV